MKTVVVGSGVIGLSAGIALCEAGFRVRMLARELPPNTTSDVAAALWYPYMARPRERVMPWAERSLARFCELAADPSTGIALRDGFEKWPDASRPRPGAVPGERRARRDELPPGCADGFAMRLPVIDCCCVTTLVLTASMLAFWT